MPKTDNPSTFEPRKVGRYLLHREIAHGGMATVHIGRLLGQVGFSRTVAIKRMHEHCARDPDFVSMFIDEARLAARIRHPNVVPTLDVVVLDGELFLVMEYVQGETLARLVRRSTKANQRIPPRVASAVIAGVLEGLHAAHEAMGEHGEVLGIVHRDVSPQNIMVGHDGVARVLDFGVAKASNRLQTTRDGQIKGKIEYMAPEQIRGSLVDRRTDVYSAACCLWEMLTGRRLYMAENQVALWGKVLEGKAEPPSSVMAEVPGSLDEVVMRGLSADPTKRYQTAEKMAIALEMAVGIATPREVGRWVLSLAGKKLRERANVVAELDSLASEISLQAEEDAGAELSSVISQISARGPGPAAAVESSEPPAPSGVKKSPPAAPPPSSVRAPRPPSGTFKASESSRGVVPPPPASPHRPAAPSSPEASKPGVASGSPPVLSSPEASAKSEASGTEAEPLKAEPEPAPAAPPPPIDANELPPPLALDAPPEPAVQGLEDPDDELSVPIRRGLPLGAIVVGIAVVLLVSGGVWFWTRGDPDLQPSTPPPVAVSSKPAAPTTEPEPEVVASAVASSAPAPKRVRLRIEVSPKTATVLIDGERVDEREIQFEESEEAVAITARAPGYEPQERQFVPASDGLVVLELARRPAQAKPKPRPTPTVSIEGPVETEL